MPKLRFIEAVNEAIEIISEELEKARAEHERGELSDEEIEMRELRLGDVIEGLES